MTNQPPSKRLIMNPLEFFQRIFLSKEKNLPPTCQFKCQFINAGVPEVKLFVVSWKQNAVYT